MKLSKITFAIAFALSVAVTSCGPKDADLATAAETSLKADPSTAGTMVSVKDGIATITGICKDDACKANCQGLVAATKGVKSVVNNCTVAPPVIVPASVTTMLDEATQQKVKDGLKDMTTLALQGFSAKGAIINGDISKAGKMKLMQMLASAKVILDPSSKITIK